MVRIPGLTKFIVGAVCLAIYVNGLNTILTTDGELIIATVIWFGAAVGCFAWGIKDVKKAGKILDLGKKEEPKYP